MNFIEGGITLSLGLQIAQQHLGDTVVELAGVLRKFSRSEIGPLLGFDVGHKLTFFY